MSTAPDTLAWLGELVAFDTTSSLSNLAMVERMRDALVQCGFACELDLSPQGDKANLLARIGPTDVPGILLSGHADTVPVAGQRWTLPSHALTVRDGRAYGRGTADMKGFLAAVMAAAPAIAAAPLRMPIHLLVSYDEEVGCKGVRSALPRLAAAAHPPRLCVIGEPTEMRPVVGHKGKAAMRCEVKGLACHSAYAPSGVNAIEYAAELIVRLTQLGTRLRETGPRHPRFEPPFATVQTGVIAGGRAVNIVPAECQFDVEIRSLPDQDGEAVLRDALLAAREALLPRMQAVHPDADMVFSALSSYPGLMTDDAHDAVALMRRWTGMDQTETVAETVAYGTEGGLISRLGIPVVVCGPGSMDQGHKPDEFVTLDQLARCDAMLAQAIAWASSPASTQAA